MVLFKNTGRVENNSVNSFGNVPNSRKEKTKKIIHSYQALNILNKCLLT